MVDDGTRGVRRGCQLHSFLTTEHQPEGCDEWNVELKVKKTDLYEGGHRQARHFQEHREKAETDADFEHSKKGEHHVDCKDTFRCQVQGSVTSNTHCADAENDTGR